MLILEVTSFKYLIWLRMIIEAQKCCRGPAKHHPKDIVVQGRTFGAQMQQAGSKGSREFTEEFIDLCESIHSQRTQKGAK